MLNLRKSAAAVAAVLGLLLLTAAAPAQSFYATPFPYSDVVFGHHFYQTGGYVSVPPVPTPIPLGGTLTSGSASASSNRGVTLVAQYSGSTSGLPGGYRGSVSGIPGGGGYSGSVFGLYNYYPLGGSYNYYPYAMYNPYWWSLYNLSGYGVYNYTAPLGSYAYPYTIPPSNYAPTFPHVGYYRSPLIYRP